MSANFFEGLRSLRLRNLSECDRIFSLPSSISFLANLELLLLGSCPNLMALPSTLLPLEKLQVLDLSKTNLNEIPEKFFVHMLSLKDLNLSSVPRLAFLPTSMSSLVNLKKPNLEGCTGLTTVHPSLTRISSSLEELNLSGFSSLKDSNKFSSSFNNMSHLRVLNLNSISVNSVSLQGCSSLETIDVGSNKNLEVLDLSGTGISTFPLEGNPDLNVLRHLDLLGVKNLRKLNGAALEMEAGCGAIQVIFEIRADDLAGFQPLLRCLEKIWISNLTKLTTMCTRSGMLENGSFGNLKLLHLEYCPQLVTVFSSGICLQNLEVLGIKFCARLDFGGDFLRIPISTTRINSDNSTSVTVTAEIEWWKQLEWEDNNVMHRICFNSWKPYNVPR
ncbi:hypothetical protein IFM89_028414, partial [Coptis chinensis]